MELRPQTLDGYIGQDHIKESLSIAVNASRKRGDALDHTLLTGPSGIGKTTLALIIANMIGSECRIVNCAGLEEVAQIREIFEQVNPHDIIFLDEVHRLPPRMQEFLYHPMEDNILEVKEEEFIDDAQEWENELRNNPHIYPITNPLFSLPPKSKGIRKTGKTITSTLKLPPITIIGATTNAGGLAKPLRDRFENALILQAYSNEEMALIAEQKAKMLDMKITKGACKNIAQRSRSTARICVNYIRRCRDVADVRDLDTIDDNIVDKALDMLGVDKHGLTNVDLNYLQVLSESARPQGINSLASQLGEDKSTLEEIVEPFLVQLKLINKTTRGRIITERGLDYLCQN